MSSNISATDPSGDEELLAMCDSEDGGEENSTAGVPQGPQQQPSPFSFAMGGSTINIDRSKDIHFGPKTVTPIPPHPSSPSLYSQDSSVFGDSISTMSRSSSLSSSQFQNVLNFSESQTSFDTVSQASFESIPESPSFSVNFNPPTSQPTTPTIPTHEAQAPTSLQANVLKKSASTPVGNQSVAIPLNNRIQQPETKKQLDISNPGTSSGPQLSAAINNSSNVQMGTQIVYNYYISETERAQSRTDTEALQNANKILVKRLSESELQPKDFLVEFKEKLANVYQKRTRSSILPWHRGKQLIPVNEYYTEPQIFAFDNCGKRTTEAVNIMSILDSTTETRFLVEGEAGVGKTLLATKLADEWARGLSLQQFKILIFVTLGDFKKSLQQYVRDELLPSYFEKEKFERIWDYCKNHDREILFILDGYDEMESSHDKREIHSLLRSKDFPESKVVATSRPNILQDWEKKIVVSGFSQIQVLEFIDKYFRAIGSETSGQSLRKLIGKDDRYWNLAKRPLFCVLLCMLYVTRDIGECLPERQSDVMLQIILCLIKWNRKNNGISSIEFDSLPAEYEKPFNLFGKLCLNALKTEKSRFTDQEVKSVDGFESKLQQLGFLFNDNESHALGERKFWKPVHQTFLEYLGAYHMAKHLRECKSCKECAEYNTIFQRSPEVLKFCVGIMNHKAYKLLDGQRFSVLWKLPTTKILQLLKEAEATTENCQAIARLLDQTTVEVSTSAVEFEGWSSILSQPFRHLTTLKIAWRIKSTSPDQESSFSEASQAQYENFFGAVSKNESIKHIYIRAKQDGEPFSKEKIDMFFSHLKVAFGKKNLKELQIVEMKMKASRQLRYAIENQQAKEKIFQYLKILKLHTFMADEDLMGICDCLRKCAPVLESLHLEGLEHGTLGFQSLVKLLKVNSTIKHLHLSMNQSLFMNFFDSDTANKEDYPPVQMRTEQNRMNKTAGRKSKTAFSEKKSKEDESPSLEEDSNTSYYSSDRDKKSSKDGDDNSKLQNKKWNKESSLQLHSSENDPRKELSYLFDKLDMSSGQWNIEARHHWYLRKSGCELRIPLPVCISREHKSVFHFLFSAIPQTNLKTLTLSQAGLYLTTPDLICLGDAVRKSVHLTSLNLQSLDKVESYLPLLIGIGQSSNLAFVNISSSKVMLNDVAFEVSCSALRCNTSLKSLSLGRWQFHLQNSESTLKHISSLFSSWQVCQLDLKQSCIDLTDQTSPPVTPSSPCTLPLSAFFSSKPFDSQCQPWKTLRTIALEGVEFKESSGLVRRGHLLLSGLTNFVNLASLDLSVSQARSIQMDNVAARRFFGTIGSELKQLSELKLDNWEFCLQQSHTTDVGHDLASQLRSCRKLKKVCLERVNEVILEDNFNSNRSGSTDNNHHHHWCKFTFLHQLVSYIPCLEDLSLCYYRINKKGIDSNLATRIGSCLHDHWHNTPFCVQFFNLSPEVDTILYKALKKPPYRVKKLNGPSLLKTYNVRYILNLKKVPISL